MFNQFDDDKFNSNRCLTMIMNFYNIPGKGGGRKKNINSEISTCVQYFISSFSLTGSLHYK